MSIWTNVILIFGLGFIATFLYSISVRLGQIVIKLDSIKNQVADQ